LRVPCAAEISSTLRTKGALDRYRVVFRIPQAKEQPPMPVKAIPEGYHTATPYLL